MPILVTLAMLAVAFLFIAGSLMDGEEIFGSVIFIILGVFTMAIVVSFAPLVLKTGMPVTTINAGEYRVAFVYVAGDNVSLGIEHAKPNTTLPEDRLYLYQFKKEAFEGQIMTDSKTLQVIESGSFKKLRLK